MLGEIAKLAVACTVLLSAQQLGVSQAYAQPAAAVATVPTQQRSAAPTGQADQGSVPAASGTQVPGPSWVVFDRTTGRWFQQQLVLVTVPAQRGLGFQPGINPQTQIAPPTGGITLGAVAINPHPVFQLARRGGTLQPNAVRPPSGKLPTRLSQVATVPAPRMKASSMMAATTPSVAQQSQAQPAFVQQSGSQPFPAQATALPQPQTQAAPAANLTAGVYPRYPAYQPPGPFPLVRSGLRPITPTNGPFANLLQPIYPAPLSAGPVNRTATRDETQAGLAPTILR